MKNVIQEGPFTPNTGWNGPLPVYLSIRPSIYL